MLLHEDLTSKIIACAIDVHTHLGPCLQEYSYQKSLAIAMRSQSIPFEEEPTLIVRFHGVVVGWHRPDFIVDDRVVVEVKSVIAMPNVFRKQVLTYLQVTKLHVGLLFNFNVPSMNEGGIKRFVL